MVPRGVRAAWCAAALCLLVVVPVLAVARPGRPLSAGLDVLPQLAAALVLAQRGRGEGGRRARAWWLAVLAVLAYAWTSAFYVAQADTARRFPGLADLSLVTYPALLAALTLFWRARAPDGPRVPLLDGAGLGLALAALDDLVLIAPRVGGGVVGLATYGQVVYATGDVFLLGFLLAGALLAEWPAARAAPWLGAGLAIMSLADTELAARVVHGQLAPGRVTEIGWALGTVVLAGAATASPRSGSGPPLRLAGVLVPALSAAVALPVVIAWAPGDDPARLIIATLALITAGVRLALGLADNTRLLGLARAGEARQAGLAALGRRALEGEELDALRADGDRLATQAPGEEPPEVAFREAVANVLAAALERHEAAERLRELAAGRRRLVVETLESGERERERIAVGLHDLALQEVLAARQELDDIDPADTPHLVRARGGLARAARDLRETVSELHPVVLEHAGLEPALEALARRQSERAGFAYALDIDSPAARGREEVLVSLAGELLSNIARHAGARQVTVRVSATGGAVALEVSDDGCGARPSSVAEAARAGHIGLASWMERIEALGGRLAVAPRAGGGTTVRAELPPP